MDEKLKAMVQDEDNFEVWYKDQAAQYSHCDVSEPGHLLVFPPIGTGSHKPGIH